MPHTLISRLAASAALAMFVCLATDIASAAAPVSATPAALLKQAEAAKLSDHVKFLRTLQQLHQEPTRLSTAQGWHLRYLDAWQLAFANNFAAAKPMLHDIIKHSNNASLSTRASALLIGVLTRSKQYVEAYTLANKLLEGLPKVTEAQARAEAVLEISQLLSWVGQYDLAASHLQGLLREQRPGKEQCATYSYLLTSRSEAGTLSSDAAELRMAIAMCLANNEIVFANTLRLDKADLLAGEGHPAQAIALLHKIAPSIEQENFANHVHSLPIDLAQAYLQTGDDAKAKASALAALATLGHQPIHWVEQSAYNVLYQVEKRAGHDAAALSWYEQYVALDEAANKDARARALAYQMVKQDVVANKLRLDALGKRNKILQLNQTLANNKAQTSRLYIALLLIALGIIIMGMYWLRRSQLRFRSLARHDGLTGAFNRQHFLEQAQHALARLHAAGASACLVLLDLDHFKEVNDTHGHAAGDDVLTRAVAICRGELRASDVFGRLGGEEFGILMPACSCAQGTEVSHRIRRTLAATSTRLDPTTVIRVSASFGLACTHTSGYVLAQLLSAADAALYRAKDAGRNQLIVNDGNPAPTTTTATTDCARDSLRGSLT